MGKILEHLSESELPTGSVKLVFLDIDGTIADSRHQISDDVKLAIKELQRRGVIVALATGRASFAAQDIAGELGIIHPCVFFSGGLLLNPSNKEVIFEQPLQTEDAVKIISAAKELGLWIEIYTRDYYFVEGRSFLSFDLHKSYLKREPEIKPFDEIISSQPIIKIMLITEDAKDKASLEKLLQSLKSFSTSVAPAHAHSGFSFVNIGSPLASRPRVFKAYLRHYNLEPAEVAAFGDTDSDLDFLMLSRFGTAMGNASPSVKEAAPYVTKTVDEGGVIYALKKYGLLK